MVASMLGFGKGGRKETETIKTCDSLQRGPCAPFLLEARNLRLNALLRRRGLNGWAFDHSSAVMHCVHVDQTSQPPSR